MKCRCEELAGPDVALHPSCIGNLWIFENLKPEELAAMAENTLRKRYPKGADIFFQGEPAVQMFLIKGGRVKLTKVTENGSEIMLDIRKAGDFLGENMLNEDTVFPVTATCLTETVICGFTKPGFEALVVAHPNVGLQVIKNLSKRIDTLTQRVGSLSCTNLEDRLYRVLITVAKEHGTPGAKGMVLDMPLTHEDLSFLVGAHRVSITRAMKGLKESGRILTEGRTLILPPEAWESPSL